MRADSRAVRCAVMAPDTSPWYAMSRSTSDLVSRCRRDSGTHDSLGPGAVDLDLGAVGGRVAVERGAHHTGQVELAADDTDVAAGCAAGADHGRQLVVERRQERGPRLLHQRDHATGTVVHEGEHLVGTVHGLQRPAHGRMIEDLLPPSDVPHGSAWYGLTTEPRRGTDGSGRPGRGAVAAAARRPASPRSASTWGCAASTPPPPRWDSAGRRARRR